MVTHPEMVAKLAKPGDQIASELTPENLGVLLAHARDMVANGNALDRAKKQAVYNKDMGMVDEPEHGGLEGPQAHLLHMAVGIAGEAAELLDAVLKHIDGERLDIENCIEELGDIDFYAEGFRQGISVTHDEVLDANIEKLSVRYNGLNYSDQAAQDRADKN